ncbi:MAG: hypothetical protein ACLUZX_09915 [Subdoligranulum sp.]
MNRQNPSYSGQPHRSTGSSTHHKSSRKQYTMYREPPEKDPKPHRRRSTDGVTAAQLSQVYCTGAAGCRGGFPAVVLLAVDKLPEK